MNIAAQVSEGVLVERGPDLLIPETDLKKIDAIAAEIQDEKEAAIQAGKRECAECGAWFTPRSGSGGRPQRFCTTECRQEHHASNPNAPNVAQRGETPDTLPAISEREHAERIPAEDPERFDWGKAPQVVFREQPATAIYRNPRGDLVIRQERTWDQDEDTFVIIADTNIMTFIDNLCDLAGIPSAGRP